MSRIDLVYGHGPGEQRLDLLDHDSHYVLYGAISFSDVRESGGSQGSKVVGQVVERSATFDLLISGADNQTMLQNKRAFETFADLADAAYGPLGTGQPVRLYYEWGDTDTGTWFTVKQVVTEYKDIHPTFLVCTVTVVTVGTALGVPVRIAESVTLTQGTAGSVYIGGVKGDTPALCKLTIRDKRAGGGGVAVNRWLVGRHGHRNLYPGGYTPVLNATPVSPATSVADASAVGGTVARLAGLTDTYQRVATVVQPAGDQEIGRRDVWAVVKDSSAPIATPSAPSLDLLRSISVFTRAYAFDATSATTHTFTWGVTTTDAASGALPTDRKTLRFIVTSKNTSAAPTAPGYITRRTIGAWYVLENYDDTAELNVTVSHGGVAMANFEVWGIVFDGVAAGASSAANDQHARDYDTSQQIDSGVTPKLSQAYELALAWLKAGVAVGGTGVQTPIIENPTDWKTEMTKDGGIIAWYQTDATDGIQARASIKATDGAPWWADVETYKALTEFPPSLDAATYHARVVALDGAGGYSAASSETTLVVGDNSAIQIDWSAVSGAATYWLFLMNQSDGIWKFVEVDGTSYTLTNMDDLTPGDYPTVAVTTTAQLRAVVGLASGGGGQQPGPAVFPVLANGHAEAVYFGTFPWPPVPRRQDGTVEQAALWFEASHPTLTGTNLDIDAVWLLPHDEPQAIAEVPAMDVVVPATWVIDSRHDGRATCVLYDTGGDEQGAARALTAMTLNPGGNILSFLGMVSDATTEGYVASATTTYTVEVEYVPTYRDFTGVP